MYSLFTANSGIHRLTWGLVFELGCRKEASIQTEIPCSYLFPVPRVLKRGYCELFSSPVAV